MLRFMVLTMTLGIWLSLEKRQGFCTPSTPEWLRNEATVNKAPYTKPLRP